jgi:hypothetical protein
LPITARDRTCRGNACGGSALRLTHPTHGELVLFMTTIGKAAHGYRYEIPFN